MIPGLAGRVRTLVAAIVAKTAADIETNAKAVVPVDTGNLKNSIQMDISHVSSDLHAEVNVGATYGAYVEYGTVKMAAKPFLTPAVELARKPFEKALGAAIMAAVKK